MQRIGKYQVVRLVARGGMGELYLARDPGLDREVAVKVMSEDIMRDEQARARFNREAKAAARLQHRNIVTVFDFAHDGDLPYIVMEFLRGQSLAERLRKGPPLTLGRTLDLARQLCDGLHFAHGEGVVHRDVKPANIWLLDDGGVKLVDFGIAKSLTGTLTHGSGVVGSAAYMSPEQIEGQPVDGRSDVFSVGAVLFELVAGRRPFDGDSVTAVMMKITQDEPAPDVRTIAPDTRPDLATIIARALKKAPSDRYPDAAEMGADLGLIRLELTERDERGHPTIPQAPNAQARRDPVHPTPKEVVKQKADLEPDQLTTRMPGAARTPAPSPVAPAPPPPAQRDRHAVPDYDRFRQPDDRPRMAPVRMPTVTPAQRRRRWPLALLGVAVVAVIAGAVLLVWPELWNPPPRLLRVTSVPAGARILLNGIDSGMLTPAEFSLGESPTSVRLELTAYEPFVEVVTEESFRASGGDRIDAKLVAVAPPPPSPTTVATTTVPPVKWAEVTILQSRSIYANCTATIGRWKGTPFDGVTAIKLEAKAYPISIECDGELPVEGTIRLPAGKKQVNFADVIVLTSPQP